MIDVHSHIIFGVDDGPSNIEQSLEMLKEADSIGIRTIIASPHFHETVYDLERVENNYQELLYRAKPYDVDIQLAYEIYIEPGINFPFINTAKSSLNKSGLMLFEFPYRVVPDKCIESVYELNLHKIVPVIAHIERNRSLLRNFGSVVSLIKAGSYIQVDAASIVGVYGSKVREYTKKLIQMRLVDMVASNAHCAEDYSKWYLEAYNSVVRWAGKESAVMLFHNNAEKILEGDNNNIFIPSVSKPYNWRSSAAALIQN